MKKTLLGLLTLLLPLTATAQLISVQPGTGREPQAKKHSSNDSVKADFSASIVSQYIWRGQELSGMSFQPSATVSWHGLSLIAEGSTSLDKGSYRDLDLTLRYNLGPVNIGVTDYWSSGLDIEDRYFYYDQHKGGHILEGNLGFSCKYFSLQGYCMFWGNDFKLNGDRAYSTYIELGIPFRLGNLNWQLTAGGTPMESAGSWEVLVRDTELGEREVNTRVWEYAEGPACCFAALRCTKEFRLGDIRMPVFAEVNANPYLAKGYFIMGVSVCPW
jgi:hypothetical protein